MRIALDAMGGDNAPGEIIKGAIEAVETLDSDDEIIIVGIQDQIESHLAQFGGDSSHITIVNAPEVIGMDEPPIDALKKKRKSSIAVMAKMASKHQVEAVISAGNTGACVAGCQLRMRNLEGVNRSGIAVILPMLCGPVTMCDVGANVSCRPVNLYQYAVMAALYSKQVLGIENPRVGLMSIGEEDTKGNELVKRTRELLKSDSNLNFIGNVQGRDLFYGGCDVAICEGFMGNVVLKITEGLAGMLFKAIKQELMEKDIELAKKFQPVIGEIYRKYDYHEYGGAPLLGVNGTAMICHGSSKSRTIKNAIVASKKFYINKINQQIVDYLANSSVGSENGK
jgi:glycerol-3-phosphate acyltransferase PlsX